MSLFAELKRRNVFRVSAAYLALGWIVTQVTSTVAPMLHLPAWIGPVVLWIGVIGFPFVVMFSWIYELTPEGLKREREVERDTSITHLTARRLDYVVIALLVVAIGLFGWGQFRGASRERLTVVAQPQQQPAANPGAATTTTSDRSVAVLPFVDMSAGRDQEYFADGISEEVLNLLAKVPQLRVIARTSSFAFKGKEADIAEIARKLGVAHVLEGSVRTSGDKVRITAQLIRASDSSHLWSETYDRQLTDVFAVQDEIASAVVSQLKVSLLGAAPKARATDPKAYALFLQARELARQYNVEAFVESEKLYRQALAIDPSYTPAAVGLSLVYFGRVDLGVLTPEQGIAQGKTLLVQAMAADPGYAQAYATLALYEGMIERNYTDAARNLERAFELDPSDPELAGLASAIARRLGRLDLAIALGEYHVSRDPVNVDAYDAVALAARYKGEFDKSIAAYRTLLSLAPDAGWQHTAYGNVLLQVGDAAGALAEYQKEPIECFRLGGLSAAYRALGRQAEAEAALTSQVQRCATTKPFSTAVALATSGDADGAFAMLDKAAAVNDLDLGAITIYPSLASLHDDPRWLPLLRRLGIAPEQLAAIKLDVQVPK